MRILQLFLRRLTVPAAALGLVILPCTSQAEETSHGLTAVAELGFLSVLSNRAQFGRSGTYLDYRSDAGQENLYFNTRWSLDLELGNTHHVILLYQPLELATTNLLPRDLIIDDGKFSAGTPVEFTYGFPFYRASYLYDVVDEPKHRLAVGGSLQIRNANITFDARGNRADLDGDEATFRAQRGIGPVPLLKAVWEYAPNDAWWFGSEIDGIYAPISYFNGSDNDVEGALLDWSWRVGIPLSDFGDVFLNLRYLAGGAEGASDNGDKPGDGYVKNWLQFGALTVGFRLDAMSKTR